jgi:hypothetical protein
MLFSSAREDELPMTMQVAMIGSDGIVLASDLKWVTNISTYPPRRTHHFESKIRIHGGIAISCAGEMLDSLRLADEIISHWHEGEGNALRCVRACENPPLQYIGRECILAVASSRRLIHLQEILMEDGDSGKRWQFLVNRAQRVQTAGDEGNDARFWLRYYDTSLSVEELKGLAAHLVVEAQNFNNAMIGGLEVVVSNDAAFRQLSEEECQRLEADARKNATEVGGLILRPSKHE